MISKQLLLVDSDFLNRTVHSVPVCVFIDAQPTDAERELWEQVNKVLTEAVSVLQDLQSYSGAGESIRQVSVRDYLYIYRERERQDISNSSAFQTLTPFY